VVLEWHLQEPDSVTWCQLLVGGLVGHRLISSVDKVVAERPNQRTPGGWEI
jgi:hypothetical protein